MRKSPYNFRFQAKNERKNVKKKIIKKFKIIIKNIKLIDLLIQN